MPAHTLRLILDKTSHGLNLAAFHQNLPLCIKHIRLADSRWAAVRTVNVRTLACNSRTNDHRDDVGDAFLRSGKALDLPVHGLDSRNTGNLAAGDIIDCDAGNGAA